MSYIKEINFYVNQITFPEVVTQRPLLHPAGMLQRSPPGMEGPPQGAPGNHHPRGTEGPPRGALKTITPRKPTPQHRAWEDRSLVLWLVLLPPRLLPT